MAHIMSQADAALRLGVAPATVRTNVRRLQFDVVRAPLGLAPVTEEPVEHLRRNRDARGRAYPSPDRDVRFSRPPGSLDDFIEPGSFQSPRSLRTAPAEALTQTRAHVHRLTARPTGGARRRRLRGRPHTCVGRPGGARWSRGW